MQVDLYNGRKTVVVVVIALCSYTLVNLQSTSFACIVAGHHWRESVSSLTEAVRWSYGAGLILRLGGVARLELNYVVPVKVQPMDRSCSFLYVCLFSSLGFVVAKSVIFVSLAHTTTITPV